MMVPDYLKPVVIAVQAVGRKKVMNREVSSL